MKRIRMAWGEIPHRAVRDVRNVLMSGWLSRKRYIPELERAVARRHQGKHGVMMSSGTDALRASLLALKELRGWKDGDEVIVPALTFVATVNVVIQAGLKPVFCDVDVETGNLRGLDVTKAMTFKTKAVIPVHLLGQPAPMSGIVGSVGRDVSVLEDSCETFGVHRLTGDAMCFSFYMSHHVQAGVGGMVVTDSDALAKICRSVMNHGRDADAEHFRFLRGGYSSRVTEMEAAVGLASLGRLDEDLAKRRDLADAYANGLAGVMRMLAWSDVHSWMFYPVVTEQRGALMDYLLTKGVETREMMPLVNQPVMAKLYRKGSCPDAEKLTENGLLLPLHPQMTTRDVGRVCRLIRRFFS